MKNTVLFLGLFCLLVVQQVYAQTYEYVSFPDSNAIWSEIYYPGKEGEEDSYERFALSGEDTVINNLTYKKLYLFYDTLFNVNNATCIGGIREDSLKRVYFRGDTAIHNIKPVINFYPGEELLLYDFSLQVDDTLKEGNFLPDNFLIVQDIDTVQIGNTLRKRFHLGPYAWIRWIEGIGSIDGLLYPAMPVTTCSGCGDGNALICFKHNDTILYFNDTYDDCMPLLTGIEDEWDDPLQVTVYPNPVSDGKMVVEFSENGVEWFEIMDCRGVVLTSIDAGNQFTLTIDIAKYLPGIYFYVATDFNSRKHAGKFVVQ